MAVDNLELAITNMFALFPLVQRKIMKPENLECHDGLSHSHFQIIYILNVFGILPVSEIANKMAISRSNMTPLIDKLIKEELVQRLPSEQDRRIINIALTDYGRKFLEEHQKSIMNYLRKRLSCLADEDLIELAVSFENIKKVISKLS
jgi:DNA-binding MarR family transcriptional regulator